MLLQYARGIAVSFKEPQVYPRRLISLLLTVGCGHAFEFVKESEVPFLISVLCARP